MSNKAIRHLHTDIQHLHQAQHHRAERAHELRKDEKALKSDVRLGKREHDRFDKDHKAYKKEHAKLLDARADEAKALQPLQAQEADLQAQYDASVDPLTQQGDPTLLAELDAVKQQEADVRARLDPRIQAEEQEVQKLRDAVHQGRLDIRHTRAEIKQDRKELKQDKPALEKAREHVKNARHRALKDLRPAEYKMGLKATNRARHELGLKSVDHVIRPGVPNVVGGQVGKWIAEAQTILKQHGIPLSKMNARDIAMIIQHESGGNPRAVNNWDSNAAAGHPSEGLMQTIGPTFNSYKLPGHGNILNPVDNIIAGVRYAISRYGSISNVPGVRAVHSGGAYVGY